MSYIDGFILAITSDVAKGIAELKQGRGLPLSVQGSSELIQTLLE